MEGTQQRCQFAEKTGAIAAFSPSCASEITSFTLASPRCFRRVGNFTQKGLASDPPIDSPSISHRPSWFTAPAIIVATGATRPSCRILRQEASSHRLGHSPSMGRFRKAFIRTSICAYKADTWDLLMPCMPKACTRSSTWRVDTSPIQGFPAPPPQPPSWTARAAPERRGSRFHSEAWVYANPARPDGYRACDHSRRCGRSAARPCAQAARLPQCS